MKIGCIYTVDTYFEVDKPFSTATELPFGISIIITVLHQNGHDVELFVITLVDCLCITEYYKIPL